MKTFFSRLHPVDFIAILIISGGFILLAKGVDTVVGGSIIMVVTYYFVKRIHDDNTKNN